MVVSVGGIPEWRCRLPFCAAVAKPACCDRYFASPLCHGRIPDGQQVAVGTFDDGRMVIMPVKERAV
ncbi:MAG: hypothetical protein ACYTBJ_23350, partial [Planctomycetota bacterium]